MADRQLARENLRLAEADRSQSRIDKWAGAVAGYEWRAVEFGYGEHEGILVWRNDRGGLEFVEWPEPCAAWLRPEAAIVRLGLRSVAELDEIARSQESEAEAAGEAWL